MELKILQGNNLAESSQKAADDDFINEVLEKFATERVSDGKVLTQANAKDACLEVYEKKKESDPFKASE